MGRRRTPGLEWLDPEDRKQRPWALNYLWERNFLPGSKGPRSFIGNREIQEIGNEMELDSEGRMVLMRMKQAWRQIRKKYTDDSIKICTFSLKTTTKANLQEIAKAQQKNMTALLEELIDKAYKTHRAKEKKQNPTQSTPGNTSKNRSGSGAEPIRHPTFSGNSIQPNHRASFAPHELVNPAASNVIDHRTRTTTAEPTLPDSSDDIVMPGLDIDIPTAEETAHSTRGLKRALKNKLDRKKARTEASEVHTPKFDPSVDPSQPPEPDPE